MVENHSAGKVYRLITIIVVVHALLVSLCYCWFMYGPIPRSDWAETVSWLLLLLWLPWIPALKRTAQSKTRFLFPFSFAVLALAPFAFMALGTFIIRNAHHI